MARPREFNREEAVEGALGLFWQKGFASASTNDLLKAMNIGRQSLYNTFGDKRQLHLQALESYCARSISGHVATLEHASSPLAGIQAVLFSLIQDDNAARARGCMGVNSVCEFGDSDPDIVKIRARFAGILQERLIAAIKQGQAIGEIDPSMKAADTATFIQMTLSGIQISARAGADAKTLRSMARFAVDRLKTPA